MTFVNAYQIGGVHVANKDIVIYENGHARVKIFFLNKHRLHFFLYKELSLRIDTRFPSNVSLGFLISVGPWDIIQNSISFRRINQAMHA